MTEPEPRVVSCPTCEGSGRQIVQVGGMRSAGNLPCQACAGLGRRIEEPWIDEPDEWSPAIRAAYPTRSGSHEEYALAMKMVGNRHSKGELVALVNWLLVENRKGVAVDKSPTNHCHCCLCERYDAMKRGGV